MKFFQMLYFRVIAFLICFPIFTTTAQGNRNIKDFKASAAIKHVNEKNILIEGLDFTGVDGDIIGLYDCENVIIRNNRFRASNKRGVYLYNCRNVRIIDNIFENVHTALTASTSQGVRFEYNDVINIGGLLSESDDTNNGFVVQFIGVTGENNSVNFNAVENIFGQSSPGDLININQSHGTKDSPIEVIGNWLRGGGPSPSGGGILLGDLGGSYQLAEDNILVDPGQYGIGIGGGNNMTLRNNRVYGKKQYFTNVAISVCNWSEKESGPSHSIRVEQNIVNYTNRDGIADKSLWIYKNMEPVVGAETNIYDPELDASILPEIIINRHRNE